uniref:Uncharacterized protein n=1 Tax=viral metagenome TaxID=1070528 RepID=A0A6M3JHA5_9ZZZZ
MKKGYFLLPLKDLEDIIRLKEGIHIVHAETYHKYPGVLYIYIEGDELESITVGNEVRGYYPHEILKEGENE